MQSLLDELKEMQAKLSAIIVRLEAEHNTVTAMLAEIRRVAVLEEIYRAGGTVTAKEVSCFAEKYGKTPNSTAGYYSGNKPSLTASEDRLARVLTETGRMIVLEKREEWGEDWLERVPMEIVSNAYARDTEIVF